jgi:uncharacterized protein (TIGR03000 family)
MRKWLCVCVLALAGLVGTSNRASAWWAYPPYSAAAFPMITPSGYYSNLYYFAWYYPWYANYNYANGWYANWWWGGGYAWYTGQMFPIGVVEGHHHHHGLPGEHHHPPVLPVPCKEPPPAVKTPAKVSIAVPADAKVLFNGVAAAGSGESRVFTTPDLNPNQDYEYVLTAEAVRDGQTIAVSERVIVRAGQETKVTLMPAAAARR